jgi:hypothetical protein
MSIEIELRTMILEDDAVEALVGTRVFPALRIEDTALPAVVYTTTRSDAEQALAEQTTLSKSTIRYECIATSLAVSRQVAEAVRQSIAGITGTVGDIERVAVRFITLEDNAIDPFDGSGDPLFSTSIEFEVFHGIPSIGV